MRAGPTDDCMKAAYSAERPESYDVWSIGVILLELILGTPEVCGICYVVVVKAAVFEGGRVPNPPPTRSTKTSPLSLYASLP